MFWIQQITWFAMAAVTVYVLWVNHKILKLNAMLLEKHKDKTFDVQKPSYQKPSYQKPIPIDVYLMNSFAQKIRIGMFYTADRVKFLDGIHDVANFELVMEPGRSDKSHFVKGELRSVCCLDFDCYSACRLRSPKAEDPIIEYYEIDLQ